MWWSRFWGFPFFPGFGFWGFPFWGWRRWWW